MYDQTYDPSYCPPSRPAKDSYDTTFDRSLAGDKRFVANETYGRHATAHPYSGTTEPCITNTTYSTTGHRHSDSKMLVNVGGVRHEILYTTLAKFPGTRLGLLKECRTEDAILNYCDYYSYDENEYFFDKNARIFASVISCYRTGKLHIPDEFCLSELVTELRYWGFDESFLDMCCAQKYRVRKIMYQEMRAEAETEMYQMYGYQYDMFDDRFGIGRCAVYRKFLNDSYENPRISKTTKVLPVISIIFNVMAVVAVALHSVESIRDSSKDKSGKVIENVILTRVILVSVTWISIEYVLRLFSSPTVTRFLFDGCNIIDLLGCGLYFYMLLQSNKLPERLTDLFRLYIMLRSWKIPWDICKLFYDRQTLRVDFGHLVSFNKQFCVLLLFFLTGVIMFSTAIYTAEKDEPESPFTSIPETFWYTIATLTTAGNTPVHPSTVSGKYFGALCSLVGLLFLASVITIGNFVRVLQNTTGVASTPAGSLSASYASRQPHPQPMSTATTPITRSEDATSFHHITFNDDQMNALGTIDVLVERDKKPIREPTSHTNNKVKMITLRIRMDPLKGATSRTAGSKVHASTTVAGVGSASGAIQSFFNQSSGTTTGNPSSTAITGANDRAYVPSLV